MKRTLYLLIGVISVFTYIRCVGALREEVESC